MRQLASAVVRARLPGRGRTGRIARKREIVKRMLPSASPSVNRELVPHASRIYLHNYRYDDYDSLSAPPPPRSTTARRMCSLYRRFRKCRRTESHSRPVSSVIVSQTIYGPQREVSYDTTGRTLYPRFAQRNGTTIKVGKRS